MGVGPNASSFRVNVEEGTEVVYYGINNGSGSVNNEESETDVSKVEEFER